MTDTDVVKKLIGPIQPVGETNKDNQRFNNLKAMCCLVQDLVNEIQDVSKHKDRHEHSIKVMGQFAHIFLKQLKQ